MRRPSYLCTVFEGVEAQGPWGSEAARPLRETVLGLGSRVLNG